MDTNISMKTDGAAENMAASGLQAFQDETRHMSNHVSGITVRMAEAGEGESRGTKSIRVRVDIRNGGRYLIEAEGEDWKGLIRSTAQRTKRGLERELTDRWVML